MSDELDFEKLPLFLLEEIDAIWLPNDPPTKLMKDSPLMISFYHDLVRGIWFGDENILLQDRGEKVMKLLQSYGLIDLSLSARDLIFEGKKRSVEEFKKVFNSPEVQKAFSGMLDAVKDTLESLQDQKNKKIEEEALKKIKVIHKNQLN